MFLCYIVSKGDVVVNVWCDIWATTLHNLFLKIHKFCAARHNLIMTVVISVCWYHTRVNKLMMHLWTFSICSHVVNFLYVYFILLEICILKINLMDCCLLSMSSLLSLPSGYLPNGIHAVEAMLAAASIGAIWSSTSVDFGVNVRTALYCLWLVVLYFHVFDL